jgi:sugar-specific transcriptional regulator TrmB
MFVYDLEDDLLYSLGNIIRFSERHVSNLHPDLQKEQIELLQRSKDGIKNFMDQILQRLNLDIISEDDYKDFKKVRKELIKQIEDGVSKQISWATSKKLSGKNSDLLLTILFSSKNIIVYCSRLVKLFYKIKSDDSTDILDKLLEE